MSWKFVIGIVFCYICVLIVSAVVENGTMPAGEMSNLESLMTLPQVSEAEGFVGNIEAYVNYGTDAIGALLKISIMDFSFFDGWLRIVQLVIFLPLLVAVGWLVVSFMRGTNA